MKFTIAYTLLFLYVIAAILFWGYSLQKQSNIIYNLEKEKIALLQKTDADISIITKEIENKKIRRHKQYLGEGATFLIIILITAFFVYRAFYKQLKLTKLQRNFMSSITHELKSPLAGIMLNLQTLQKRKLEEEIQKKLLSNSMKEAHRLSDLCNNIMLATQMEENSFNFIKGQTNLIQTIDKVLNDFEVSHGERKINTDIHFDELIIKGDNTLWELVLSNLLENAHKYSDIKNDISILLIQKNSKRILQIIDEGEGIADNEKEEIFKKFYRIGNENTRKSKGTGIGLYLVKKIVQFYKYDISVRNNSPKGSIFEINFK
ncbi:MAG: GHKL domain-containing protein [Chitinophagaceae bacterium]|nr:GHKL domain-containing protein [Chitinophagaceae bacterium]